MKYSENWVGWITAISLGTCTECFIRNRKMYSYDDLARIRAPKLHDSCKCHLEKIMAIVAGKATLLGTNGADWWLTYLKDLPDYYISRQKAEELGWRDWKGNLDDVAPGCMLFGGIYKNKDEVLPEKNGRIWYEVDINYKRGYRNAERIVFSNDGLIFVTYDHCKTFIEIIGEE